MILHVLIWVLMVPAALSASAIATARRLGRGPTGGRRGRWGVAAGLGLGYVAGHLGLIGAADLPTPDSTRSVPWLVLAAALLGVVETTVDLPGRSRWALRGLFVAITLGVVLRPRVEGGWSPAESVVWLVGLEAALLASWWNLEAQAERLSGPGWVVPLGLVSVGWAVVQSLGGRPSAWPLDGVLASTFLGALPTVGLRPGLALSRGGTPVALTALAGIGLAGHLDAGVPALSAALLAVAPWAPWVDRIGVLRRRSYWTRASARFLVVLVIVGVAAFHADTDASPPAEGPAGP